MAGLNPGVLPAQNAVAALQNTGLPVVLQQATFNVQPLAKCQVGTYYLITQNEKVVYVGGDCYVISAEAINHLFRRLCMCN